MHLHAYEKLIIAEATIQKQNLNEKHLP